MLGKKWLALRLSLGLVAAPACAHGQHRGPDDATLVAGTLITALLTVGAVLIAREMNDNDSPATMTPMPPMPRPILDEH
jgi:hypothetical protein